MTRLLATILWVSSASGAMAAGALALGEPGDVSKEGLAVGIAVDFATEAQASEAAIAACKKMEGLPATTIALCKVVRTFKSECVVTAYDSEPSTPGWGYGIGFTDAVARDEAIFKCRMTAGSERSRFCKPNKPMCDVKQGD